ncbi:MAG TPA: helicase-related protein [Bacteroidales bacterium]|nr:helicase-related protein [Bacteroidales bacterium]HQB75188.1 helicase-related protein [Bacteroidales bacterium]
MNNTLIDNSTKDLSLHQTLKKCILDPAINEIKIATGYWDLPGMVLIFNELKMFLEREETKFYLLIGKDPQIFPSQQIHIKTKDPKYPQDFIRTDIEELDLKPEYQEVVNLLLRHCKDDESSKIQVRIYRQNENEETQFLHSKCYIFDGKQKAYGIIGSSNFTQKGLEGNAELNYLETTPHIVKYGVEGSIKGHIGWFNEKWEVSQPWNKTFEEILIKSPLAPTNSKLYIDSTVHESVTPYDVYIRFLQNQWGEIVDGTETSMLEAFLPPEVQKLQYQFDAVNQGYAIMKRHGGFILADVVGLGKTMVGVMIIKRFLEDSNTDGRERKVLIVTPPAIKNTWRDTIDLFDKNTDNGIGNYIKFITTGSIGKLVDTDDEFMENLDLMDDTGATLEANELKNRQFGLILIDESHNFRNRGTQMYEAMDDLIGSIFPNPYIVLLSATPQNNSPKDLKNQIYLFQREPNNTTLDRIEGRKLDTFFNEKEKLFQDLRKNPKANNEELIKLSNEIRERVLDDLVVRRTRTDIVKYYQDDAKGIKFPTVKGPNLLKYEMDDELAQLFFDTMEKIAPYDTVTREFSFNENSLSFYRYRAIEYLVREDHRNLYQKRSATVEGTSRRLARIMQILLIKRLESSFLAFKTSLWNLQRFTDNMIKMLEDDVVFICPDIDVNAELDTKTKSEKSKKTITREDCYNDIREKIKQKGNNNKEFKRVDFSDDYLTNLKKDKQIIDELCRDWDRQSKDPKLNRFIKALNQTLFSKEINNPNGHDKPKLVIFTEALDTLSELKEKIEGISDYKVLAISAKNRNEKEQIIKANFDANMPDKDKRDDFDVIITTEVLAEGVNLHRSNVIVNYDTPWNSTRLMQRIGRVNRIGSKEDFIHVFNFMPTAQSDAQINLVQIAHAKIQAFHALFGEDNKIFTDAEELIDHNYDPKALQHLINGEESVYEKYISELKTLKKENPKLYDRINNLKLPLRSAKKHNVGETVCFVSSPKGKGLYISVSGDNVSNISTLEMIEALYCLPETKSEPMPKTVNVDYEKAIKQYVIFFDKMISAQDGNKERTMALKIINRMDKKVSNDEIKNLLTLAAGIVRKGNRALAKKIILLSNKKEKELSLFEIGEEDFNAIIFREFGILKKYVESNNDTNKPQLMLSTTNIL